MNHPVARKPSELAKMSPTVRSRNLMERMSTTAKAMKTNILRSRKASWKSALSLILPMARILNMIIAPMITSQEKAYTWQA